MPQMERIPSLQIQHSRPSGKKVSGEFSGFSTQPNKTILELTTFSSRDFSTSGWSCWMTSVRGETTGAVTLLVVFTWWTNEHVSLCEMDPKPAKESGRREGDVNDANLPWRSDASDFRLWYVSVSSSCPSQRSHNLLLPPAGAVTYHKHVFLRPQDDNDRIYFPSCPLDWILWDPLHYRGSST